MNEASAQKKENYFKLARKWNACAGMFQKSEHIEFQKEKAHEENNAISAISLFIMWKGEIGIWIKIQFKTFQL